MINNTCSILTFLNAINLYANLSWRMELYGLLFQLFSHFYYTKETVHNT